MIETVGFHLYDILEKAKTIEMESTAVVPEVCGVEVGRGSSSMGKILGAMKVYLYLDLWW